MAFWKIIQSSDNQKKIIPNPTFHSQKKFSKKLPPGDEVAFASNPAALRLGPSRPVARAEAGRFGPWPGLGLGGPGKAPSGEVL